MNVNMNEGGFVAPLDLGTNSDIVDGVSRLTLDGQPNQESPNLMNSTASNSVSACLTSTTTSPFVRPDDNVNIDSI